MVAGIASEMCIPLFQIIWSCLVEDSNLFLKYFMEQLTRDKSMETFQIIRKLIRFLPKLPQQAAFSLYNYIIGKVTQLAARWRSRFYLF